MFIFPLRTFAQGCLTPGWGDIHFAWLISQLLALDDLAPGSLLLTFPPSFPYVLSSPQGQTILNYAVKEVLAEWHRERVIIAKVGEPEF